MPQTQALSAPIAHAVCVNGRFAPQLSRLDALPKGVQLLGLEAAIASHPTLVEPYLAKLSLTQTNAFTSLNTAFLRDGIVLIIPARAVIEQPIEVTFASVSEGSGSVSHPRLLIVAGEASQATVLERYVGKGAAFTNAVGEVWLGPNAVVDHYKLQEEPADSFHIASMFLHCARRGTFSSHSLTFGGGLVRNDVVATLDGEGIDCTLNGLYVGRGTQLIDNHTTIDHAMPHCGSHEIYKGILGDRSRAVFNGKIIVRPDAQKTDAKQTNKALLLSDEANINSKPELEIFANDVKCTHGAAIGQLDDAAMFYLRSRGLGVSESRAHAGARVRGRHPEPREDRAGSRIPGRHPDGASAPCRVTSTRRAASQPLRRPENPARLPYPESEDSRQAARLSRQRRHDAEAAGRHRRDGAQLRRRQRQHPSRRASSQRARDSRV